MNATRKLVGVAAALLALLALSFASVPAHAATGFGTSPAFVPRVPVSAFGLARWFDPSRMHLSSTVSVGSGWGSGTNALQVTTLSYDFKAPVALSVSLGNSWGSNLQRGQQSSFFLEGFNLAYQPSKSVMFQIQYQDLRSPLQLGYGPMGLRPFRY